jgi:lipopolysaccharide assembly outer membrane protein LptD (OstA)
MKQLPGPLIFLMLGLGVPWRTSAQERPEFEIEPLNEQGWIEYELDGLIRATNGVYVRYGTTVLVADQVVFNQQTAEAIADGKVRIQQEGLIWVAEHALYNFETHQLQSEQFRTGKSPVFAFGHGLYGDMTNHVYYATNAFVTAEDMDRPTFKLRAKRLTIIPGKKIVANGATLYAGNVPIFYFPFYSRNLGRQANNFDFVPGYRSSFGPFLLGTYTWFLNEQFDGAIHVDYRERRGFGAGPDVNYKLGRWGTGTFKYYYLYDQDPQAADNPDSIPHNRQRVWFSYQSSPATNLYVKSLVRYETDSRVVREFFEGEYRQNPQPNTFVEANRFWNNFNLDAYVQPRVNDFLQTVERLPDIKLTGYRQQVAATPIYYESESSAGYYRRLFAETNGPPTGTNYSAGRADTYHQLVLPETFFGWLRVTPRVGGRFTYYSEASGPGATTDEVYRGVFNTGAEVSFKASRTWPALQSPFLEVDGLRHIVEPSVNYVYVPTPNAQPPELPQFDYELQSLRLLPIEFPDYNSIDSIDTQNVLRFGLRNKLQTKRNGAVVNLLNWDIYTDWRLKPLPGQTTFADLYSDLVFRPRSWLSWESLTRYNIDGGQFRMALNEVTFQPSSVWSWSVGQYYLQNDFSPPPQGLGEGNNLFTSSLFFHLNENWAFRSSQHFEAQTGRMQEQFYTIYRDLRSWTAALTFRLRNNATGPDDFTVAFTFSLKAQPRYGLGTDTVRPYSLLGN